MKRVLVISHDKVGQKMAGPGIRYHQIATALSKHFDVALATFNPAYLEGLAGTSYEFFDIKTYDFRKAFDKFDVIFALWLSQEMIEYAKKKKKLLIFDLYAPVPVEDLIGRIHSKRTDRTSDYDYGVSIENYKAFFKNGDYFVCSNPIQKDFWTGFAFSSGAIAPSNFNAFPVYDRIASLPMGINPSEVENRTFKDSLRTDFPSIKKDDFVIVWTGGIWDWFDAITPIKCIKDLVDSGHEDIKLVFLGTKHPNSDVPEMDETTQAYKLAEKLGLKDKHVFFREGWIDFNARLEYLTHADVALYAHKPSIEARYSHRTRVLDHFLASLPTISTRGDFLGDTAANNNMGIAVAPQDTDEMCDAIIRLKTDSKLLTSVKESIADSRGLYTWDESVKELVSFLKSPVQPRKEFSISRGIPKKQQNKIVKTTKRLLPQPIKNRLKRYLPR